MSIDLSLFLPGPLLTQFMADHGAEVIKVESLHEGEPNRQLGRQARRRQRLFRQHASRQETACAQPQGSRGVEVLMRLAEKSTCSSRHSGPASPTASASATAGSRPGAPRISSTPRSQRSARPGPDCDIAAHDLATEAMTGVLSLNRGGDGKPAMPGHRQRRHAGLDDDPGRACSMALYRRKETGRGDFLDMAMADSLLACLPNNMGVAMTQRRQPVLRRARARSAATRSTTSTRRRMATSSCSRGRNRSCANNLLVRSDARTSCRSASCHRERGQDPVREFPHRSFVTENQGRNGLSGSRGATWRSRR